MVLTEGIWEVCRSEMVPDDVLCAKFGTLNASMMTLFQILYHGRGAKDCSNAAHPRHPRSLKKRLTGFCSVKSLVDSVKPIKLMVVGSLGAFICSFGMGSEASRYPQIYQKLHVWHSYL